jgi:hypothetical protein
MKNLLAFVQAALEAFDSGVGFTGFSLSESDTAYNTDPNKFVRDTAAQKRARAADKAAGSEDDQASSDAYNKGAAASTSAGHHLGHDASKGADKEPLSDKEKERNKRMRDHGYAATMSAVTAKKNAFHPGKPGYVHHISSKLHAKAADVHKTLGNDRQAARHSKAAAHHAKLAGADPKIIAMRNTKSQRRLALRRNHPDAD